MWPHKMNAKAGICVIGSSKLSTLIYVFISYLSLIWYKLHEGRGLFYSLLNSQCLICLNIVDAQ